MSNESEIHSALNYVDSHDRDLWLKMGAALKDELGEDGFNVWDQWSSSAKNYDAKSTKSTWKSLRAGHIRINTLFYAAIQNGYQPKQPDSAPSLDELARRQAEAEQRQLQEAETQKQAQEKAKQTAQYIWQKAVPAALLHPYLITKGITNPDSIRGLKQNHYKDDNNLLIPVYQNKEIVSLQFINQDGNKRLLTNGQIKGSYSLVGDSKQMAEGMYLAEGFATAASIYQATGKPVVIAFNAGNLQNVAQTLKQNFPDTVVIIAADNDPSRTGITKAEEAVKILGDQGNIVYPDFTEEQIQRYQEQHGKDKFPTDFNDLHALEGLDSVKTLLNKEQIPIMEQPDQHTEPQQAADQAAFLSSEETKKTKISDKNVINSIEPDMDRLQAKEPEPVNQQPPISPEPEKTPDSVPINNIGSQKTKQDEPEITPEPAKLIQNTEQEEPVPVKTADKTPIGKDELKKIITDLNYKMPPASLERRYLVANGQYLSADNATTVLFEDKGKKLSTARTDTQIAQDMLEVAKTKGWDAIKLSGTKEFKQTMYVLAESQGIKTKGYRPTEADRALVERLREDHSLNSIEEETSLYTQKATANSPASENTKEPERAGQGNPNDQGKIVQRSQIDVESISKADKMMAGSSIPTTGQIETSAKADTDVDVPLQEIGQGKIPSEVIQQAKNIKTHALDTDVITTAKATYDKKAAKLSKPNQAKLQFFEKNTMDVIRDLKGDARQNAMRNYYEHMSGKMNGKTLDLPAPLQVPSPRGEQLRTSDSTQDRNQNHEMER